MKKTLALLIALLLAIHMPTVALSEDDIVIVSTDIDAPVSEEDITLGDESAPPVEGGESPMQGFDDVVESVAAEQVADDGSAGSISTVPDGEASDADASDADGIDVSDADISDTDVSDADVSDAEAPADQSDGEPASEEASPVEGETAEGETAEDEPAEGEPAEGEPTEGEPAEGEQAEDEQAEGEPTEGEPAEGEPEGEPADEAAAQAVLVVFEVVPAEAEISVLDADGVAAPAEADGAFLLLPGEYAYTAQAEGYVSAEGVAFTVLDAPLTIPVALEALPPEPLPFEQSCTLDGVEVTVRAEAGAFPNDATLSVTRALLYEQRQADAAVDEVREDDRNVAARYTFDICVLDAEGHELQPAEGCSVEVSFALCEAADENLSTDVYHVAGEAGALTAEKLEAEVDADAQTVTAVEDGFSIYTVEFTYNDLQYVLPGDTSVPMSEILTALGLTGEVTQVTISDTGLFSASNETGEWIVTAHQAFSTDEWMKVTINEIEYTIAVTDDQEITSWAGLQAALKADGSTPVILAQNITAGTYDSCLEVPSGVTVTLDLNGHTIDRGLTGEGKTAQDNGNVITVKGNLTVQDNSTNQTGKITGGNTNSNSGGVYVAGGTFKMTGGTISGNKANNGKGGGVYLDGGAFTMTGGTISGNTAKYGGGVCMNNYGTFNMSGAPEISGNKAGATITESGLEGGTDNNVYLNTGTTIIVDAALTNANPIGVSMANPGVFTSGSESFTGEIARQYFKSDDAGYAISAYESQATLAVAETISTKNVINGYATIKGAFAALNDANGDTLRLLTDVTTDSTLSTSGSNNTLDLNGYGILMKGNDSVIKVEQGSIKLTLKDSDPTRTHYITLTDGRGTAVSDEAPASGKYVKVTGGYITGGSNTGDGGGVYVEANAFAMNGGTIIGNKAAKGGGVYVSGGTFSLSGKPTVTGNTGGNVYLPEGRTIAVTDTLSGACIGVTAQARPGDAGLVTLTGGLRGRGDPSAFISDEGYAVGWNDAGTEAALGRKIAHVARGYEGVCDGAGHGITVTVTEPASGYAVRYGTSEGNYSLDRCPSYSDAGTYTVYYRVTANGYFPATGSAMVTLTPAPAPEPERKPEIVIKGDYTLLSTATVTNTSMNLGWTALPGAEGYDVFFTKCGRRSVYKMVASVPADAHNDCNITGLKKGTPYKAYVMAWRMENGQKVYLGKASPTVHAIAGGSNEKFCNAKGVSVRKTALTVKVGKKRKIKASVKGAVKGIKVLKHARKLRYYSSDRSIATVDRKGRVKGVAPGTCTVYVVANNGASKAVTVTVY